MNGTYKIRAFGNNGTQAESEEIQITNVSDNNNIVATIKAGDINNANINLTVTATTNKAGIKGIEIYVDGQKSKEYGYDGSSKAISTEEEAYTVENLEFYGAQKECYAKVITEAGEAESEKIQIENKSNIKTLKDLQNFSAQVNGTNNFNSKVIKQVGDIEITGTLAQIGDENHRFSGTYDGGEHAIKNINITSNKNYVGLFGYNEGSIKNLTASGTVSNTLKEDRNSFVYTGGIVAYNKGNITNCINNIKITGSEGTLWIGGVAGGLDADSNCSINNCVNNGFIIVIRSKSSNCNIGRNIWRKLGRKCK